MHEAPEEEGLSVGEDPRDGIEAAVDLRRLMAAMADCRTSSARCSR